MTVLYFSVDNANLSLSLSLDWLEDYISKAGVDIGEFLKSYSSEDVGRIIKALDEDGEPYTIQEEHTFSGFAD